jgi:hypothetical protein
MAFDLKELLKDMKQAPRRTGNSSVSKLKEMLQALPAPPPPSP